MTNKNKQIGLATLLLSAVLLSVPLKAQVTIGDQTAPNVNAVLDLRSNDKLGLLLPRLPLQSTTLAAPLQAHVAGMVVYNTVTAGDVTPGFYYDDGTKWVAVGSGTGSGSGSGSGTVTSFSADALPPLFTTSVATAGTTPALSFTLTNAGANTIFGNNTSASAAPNYFASSALAIAGDVTGTLGTSKVSAIQGQTLPATAPANGQTLVSDGNGNLTWQTPAAGSSRLKVKNVTTSPYNITVADDNYLLVTPNGNVTFNFPTLTPAEAGIQVRIYNSSSASLPNIYLTPENAANSNPANAGTFVWTGSAWVAVSKQ